MPLHPQEPLRELLRKTLLERRNRMPADARQAASLALVGQLTRLLTQHFGPLESLNVGAYLSIGSEPDISSLFAEFGSVAVPQVVARDAPLRFLKYQRGMALKKEGFGVSVPRDESVVEPQLLLVPCVGFHVRPDGLIDRIGYGGGFYDRTLAARRFSTIGVAFSACAVDGFLTQTHDRPLDLLVTELGTFGRSARRD